MKALIGMSGGVDSSVAAFLTLSAGYCCLGGMMHLHTALTPENTRDAAAVADRLGIPFHTFDLTSPFRSMVMQPFADSYANGLTPNPCILCNRYLKFDLFAQKARELGCSKIVTGHYARILQEPSGRWGLYKAKDKAKDQTYFLYTLTQSQLAGTLFPLGELTKEQVRTIAQEQGFLNARKQDSQDICFIPEGDYGAFLEHYTGIPSCPGNYLDLQGNIVGQHSGAIRYTLGQRKGLNLAMGSPVYVCGKDMEQNTVTVGPEGFLYHTSLLADDLNWIPFDTLDRPMRVWAKTRSRQPEQPAWVYPEKHGIRVVFDAPQRAITPGQAVVLYNGEQVLGGGTITCAFTPGSDT